MNFDEDAMLVNLRITAWLGQLYDRQASAHVAVHHNANVDAGRYNKRLLPKSAFAAIAKTMNEARTSHYTNTLPWDDQGNRLLPVDNYDRYIETIDNLIERMIRQRAHFIKDYEDNIDQARIDLGKLFRIEEYPSREALQSRFAIEYKISSVPNANHFVARLAAKDTKRVKRKIERKIRKRLNNALDDLYRRLGESVERVSDRLQEDENGKPLVFRDSMIENIRSLVDIVPRLNIFDDENLARLCEQVEDRIANVDPDELRPSQSFNPVTRSQVKRDADALMEQFAGYLGAPEDEDKDPVREAA